MELPDGDASLRFARIFVHQPQVYFDSNFCILHFFRCLFLDYLRKRKTKDCRLDRRGCHDLERHHEKEHLHSDVR